MKRFTLIMFTFLLLVTLFSGCNQADQPENSEGKISIVCTNFPQYDWVREILGNKADNVDLTLLLDSGIDLHNYQPSADDIVKISSCDLFIYGGGESDKWVDDVFNDTTNPDLIVINLLDVLGDAARTKEIVAGMEEVDEHDHDHEDEIGYDEHVWLSLKNAEVLCSAITDALSLLDSENAEVYKNNRDSYTEKLRTLNRQYLAAVNTGSVRTLLFGDRFPFRYLVEDYGLSYYAAFSGCAAESEVSFDTIVFLAEKADQLGLHTIMVTESADQSIAKTIRSNTNDKNQQILVLDAMQSVTASHVQNGVTYLSIMESNLNVLKEAIK